MTKQGGTNKIIAKKLAVEACNMKYLFILDKDYTEFNALTI